MAEEQMKRVVDELARSLCKSKHKDNRQCIRMICYTSSMQI